MVLKNDSSMRGAFNPVCVIRSCFESPITPTIIGNVNSQVPGGRQ